MQLVEKFLSVCNGIGETNIEIMTLINQNAYEKSAELFNQIEKLENMMVSYIGEEVKEDYPEQHCKTYKHLGKFKNIVHNKMKNYQLYKIGENEKIE